MDTRSLFRVVAVLHKDGGHNFYVALQTFVWEEALSIKARAFSLIACLLPSTRVQF